MKTNLCLTGLCMLLFVSASGQIGSYTYKRELTGIRNPWHSVILPDELFSRVQPDLSDIRIYGITEGGDTTEAPYIIANQADTYIEKSILFNPINASDNAKGYFFTYEVPSDAPIDQITLRFGEKNFDWKIRLEGSQDLKEWFTIVKDYRILSIQNEQTEYQFSTLVFPRSKYRYFRIQVTSPGQPNLLSASLLQHETREGQIKSYPLVSWKTEQDKARKQTVIYAELALPVPVSKVELKVKSALDYHRFVELSYLADSVQTPQGWKYIYRTLSSGRISSDSQNEFQFQRALVKKLKITLLNQDNAPLEVDSLIVKGYVSSLSVRFISSGTYLLTYGNPRAEKPSYDIAYFPEKIPANLTALAIGEEQRTDAPAPEKKDNGMAFQVLLWVFMGVIIILLGWFSWRMIQNKQLE